MTVKICALAITAVFLTVTVKKTAPFAAFCIAVAAGLAAVYLVLPDIMEIVRRIKEISVKSNISGEYTKLLLKVLGIGYLTDFSASAAKDAGENSIAQKIEFAGKISITALAMPLFFNLIDVITDLLPMG